MSLKNIVKPILLTAFDSSTLTAAFKPINPNGTEASCFLIRINNDSTEAVFVSFDGINEHDFVAAGGLLELPLQTNRGPVNQAAYLAQGTIIYVKEVTTAGTGDIFLSGYFQPTS